MKKRVFISFLAQIVTLLSISWISGCSGQGRYPDLKLSHKQVVDSKSEGEKSKIAFMVLFQGGQPAPQLGLTPGTGMGPHFFRIRDREGWLASGLEEKMGGQAPNKKPGELQTLAPDFDNREAWVFSLGEVKSTGHSIQLRDMRVDSSGTIFKFVSGSPQADQMNALVMEHPFIVFETPAQRILPPLHFQLNGRPWEVEEGVIPMGGQ